MDYSNFYEYYSEIYPDPPVYTEVPDPDWDPDTRLQCEGDRLAVSFDNAFPGAWGYHVRLVNGYNEENDTVLHEPHTRSYFQVTPEKKYRVWIRPVDKHGSALKKSWMVSEPMSCSVSEASESTETPSLRVTSTAGGDVRVDHHLSTILAVLTLVLVIIVVLVLVIWWTRRRRRRKRQSPGTHQWQCQYQPRPGGMIPNGSPPLPRHHGSPTAGAMVSEHSGTETHLLSGAGGGPVAPHGSPPQPSLQGPAWPRVPECHGQTAGDLAPSSPESPGFQGPEFRPRTTAVHQPSRDWTDSQVNTRAGIALNGCQMLLK